MKCKYLDQNGNVVVANVCNGVIYTAGDSDAQMDGVIVPAVTMCNQQLFTTIHMECDSNASIQSTPVTPPTPAETGVTKQLFISQLVDFKLSGNTEILRVPTGYHLLIDTMEILTYECTNPDIPPCIKFGTTYDDDLFWGPLLTQSNATGKRHIIDDPQNLVAPSTILTGGVHLISTATKHTGYYIITGYYIQQTT